MADGDRQAAIDRLYGVPLEAFVAERTRLSRELRSGGNRPAAVEIAGLRKPSAAAWALNHVAREDPAAVGEWLQTVQALRDASAGARDGGGDALRAAIEAHRAAGSRLLAVVRDRARPSGRPLSEAMIDRVRTVLQAATSDATAAEDLRAGRIVEATEPTGSEPALDEPTASSPEPDVAEPPRRPGKAKREPKPAPKRDRRAEARAERRAELERQVGSVSAELEGLRMQADRCAEAVQTAEERLVEAYQGLRRAKSEASAARSAAKDPEAAALSTEKKLRRLQAQLER